MADFTINDDILKWLRARNKIPSELDALHNEDVTPAFIWAVWHDGGGQGGGGGRRMEVTWRQVVGHVIDEKMDVGDEVDLGDVVWLLAAGDVVTKLWLLETVYVHARACETYESAADPMEFCEMTMAQACTLSHDDLARKVGPAGFGATETLAQKIMNPNPHGWNSSAHLCDWYRFAELEALFLYRLLDESKGMVAECLTLFGYGLMSSSQDVVLAAAKAIRSVVREEPKAFWAAAFATRGGLFDVALHVWGTPRLGSQRVKQAVTAVLAELSKADLAVAIDEEIPCRVADPRRYFVLLEDIYTSYITDSYPTPFVKLLHPDVCAPASGSLGVGRSAEDPSSQHAAPAVPPAAREHDPAMFFETDAFVGALLAREGALPTLVHRVLAYTQDPALAGGGAIEKIYVFILRVALRNLEVFLHENPGETPAPPVPPIWDEIRQATPLGHTAGGTNQFPMTAGGTGPGCVEGGTFVAVENADGELLDAPPLGRRRTRTESSSQNNTPSTPSAQPGGGAFDDHAASIGHGRAPPVTLLGLLMQHLAWLWREGRTAMCDSNIVAHIAAVMIRCFAKAVPASNGGSATRLGALAFHAADDMLRLYAAAAKRAWPQRRLYVQYLLAAARDLPSSCGVVKGAPRRLTGTAQQYQPSCIHAVNHLVSAVADAFCDGRDADSSDVHSLLELGGVVAGVRMNIAGGSSESVEDTPAAAASATAYTGDMDAVRALWSIALKHGVVLHTHALHALIVQVERTAAGVVHHGAQQAMFAEAMDDLVAASLRWAYCEPLAVAAEQRAPGMGGRGAAPGVGGSASLAHPARRVGSLPTMSNAPELPHAAAASPSRAGVADARRGPRGLYTNAGWGSHHALLVGRAGSAGAATSANGGATSNSALRVAFDTLNDRDQILRSTLHGVLRRGTYDACGTPHGFLVKVVLRSLESGWRALRKDAGNPIHALPKAHGDRVGRLLDSLVAECGGGVPAKFTDKTAPLLAGHTSRTSGGMLTFTRTGATVASTMALQVPGGGYVSAQPVSPYPVSPSPFQASPAPAGTGGRGGGFPRSPQPKGGGGQGRTPAAHAGHGAPTCSPAGVAANGSGGDGGGIAAANTAAVNGRKGQRDRARDRNRGAPHAHANDGPGGGTAPKRVGSKRHKVAPAQLERGLVQHGTTPVVTELPAGGYQSAGGGAGNGGGGGPTLSNGGGKGNGRNGHGHAQGERRVGRGQAKPRGGDAGLRSLAPDADAPARGAKTTGVHDQNQHHRRGKADAGDTRGVEGAIKAAPSAASPRRQASGDTAAGAAAAAAPPPSQSQPHGSPGELNGSSGRGRGRGKGNKQRPESDAPAAGPATAADGSEPAAAADAAAHVHTSAEVTVGQAKDEGEGKEPGRGVTPPGAPAGNGTHDPAPSPPPGVAAGLHAPAAAEGGIVGAAADDAGRVISARAPVDVMPDAPAMAGSAQGGGEEGGGVGAVQHTWVESEQGGSSGRGSVDEAVPTDPAEGADERDGDDDDDAAAVPSPPGSGARTPAFSQRCSVQEFNDMAEEDKMGIERRSTLFRLCVAKGLIDPDMKLTTRTVDEQEQRKQRMRGYFAHMDAIAAAKQDKERREKQEAKQKLERIMNRQQQIEAGYEKQRLAKEEADRKKAEEAERERVEAERKAAAARARRARRNEENKAKLEDYKRQKQLQREQGQHEGRAKAQGGHQRPSVGSRSAASGATSSPMKTGSHASTPDLSRMGSKLSAQTGSSGSVTPQAGRVAG